MADVKWARLESALLSLSKRLPELYAVYFSALQRAGCWVVTAAPAAAPPPAAGKPAQVAAALTAAAAPPATATRLKVSQTTLKVTVQCCCLWASQIAITNPHALAVAPAAAAASPRATAADAKSAAASDASGGVGMDDSIWVTATELERSGYPNDTRGVISVLLEIVRMSLAACDTDARRERIQLSVIQSVFDLLSVVPSTALIAPIPPSPALAWLLTDIAFTAYTEPATPTATGGDSKQLVAPPSPSPAPASASVAGSIRGTDYRRFVDRVMYRACQIAANDTRLISTILTRIFEQLSTWPSNPVLADFILQFVAQLKRARRFGVLFNVTKAAIPLLAAQLIPAPAPSQASAGAIDLRRCWSAYRAFEQLLIGYQSDPDAFHETISVLANLMDTLTASLPPVIATSAVTTTATPGTTANVRAQPVPPALHDRARYLYRAGQLIQCMMFVHTGYASVYAPLIARVKAADRVLSVPPYNTLVLQAAAPAAVTTASSVPPSPQLTSSATAVVVTSSPAVGPTPVAVSSTGPAAAQSFLLTDSEMEERLLSHKWLMSGKQSSPFIDGQWHSTWFGDFSLHVEEEMIGKQIRGTTVTTTGPTLDAFCYVPTNEAETVLWGTYRNWDDARKTQSTVFQAKADAVFNSFDGTFNYGEVNVHPLAALRAEHYNEREFVFEKNLKGLSEHVRTIESPKAAGGSATAVSAVSGIDSKVDAKAATAAAATAGAAEKIDPRIFRNLVGGSWAEVDLPVAAANAAVPPGGMPSDRANGATACYGSTMYLFGGLWNMSSASSEIGSIDLGTNRYTPINPAAGAANARYPPRLCAPDMVIVGRSLYVFGGEFGVGSGMGGGYSHELWRFDLDTASWSPLAGGLFPLQTSVPPSAQSVIGQMMEKAEAANATVAAMVQPPWPEQRAYHRMAASTVPGDERIFVFGGVRSPLKQIGDLTFARSTGTFFNDVWQYSIRPNRWTKLVPASEVVPRRRSSHSMSFAHNSLWIFGGQNSRNGLLDDLWRFSLDDLKWTKIETEIRPLAREYHCQVYAPLHNALFVFGGTSRVDGNSVKTNDLWKFDFKTMQWSRVATYGGTPPPRSGHFFGVVTQRTQDRAVYESLVVSAGFSSENLARRDVWRFTFADYPILHPSNYVDLLQFDGHTGFIDLAGNQSLTFPSAQPYTLEAYVLPAERRVQGIITKFNKLKAGEFAMNLNEHGAVQGFREAEPYNHNGKPIPMNHFHHVVTVYDGTTLHMYLNGRPYTQLQMGAISANTTDVRVLIGASQHDSNPNWLFNGIIMEVRVWSGTRTFQQLSELRKTPATPLDANLIGYWPLIGRPENIRDSLGAGTLDRAMKLTHHGIRSAGARWVKIPLEVINQHFFPRAVGQSLTLYGSVKWTKSDKLLMVENPKEWINAAGSVWFDRQVSVARGFDSTFVVRSKVVSEHGTVGFVIQNRGALTNPNVAWAEAGWGGVPNCIAVTMWFCGNKHGIPYTIRVDLRQYDNNCKAVILKSVDFERMPDQLKLRISYDGQTVSAYMSDRELFQHVLDIPTALGMTNRYAWLGIHVAHPGHVIVDSFNYSTTEPLTRLLAAHVQVDEPICHRILELCREQLTVALEHLKEIRTLANQLAQQHAAKQQSAATPTKPASGAAAATGAQVPAATLVISPQLAAAALNSAYNSVAAAIIAKTKAVVLAPTAFSEMDGRWDMTALGRFVFTTTDAHVHAYRVRGMYAAGTGAIRGILTRSTSASANATTALAPHASAVKDWKESGGWTLIGVFRSSDQRGWKPCRFDFDSNFLMLRGSWSNANESGTFTGQRVELTPVSLSNKKGLVNLGNTCYMNSFLQAMYMTVGLRHELLRVPCAIDYLRADMQHERKLKLDGKEVPKQPINPLLLPPGPHGACLPSPTVTIQRLQRLYMHLLLSQKSACNPYDFQCGLPDPWRGPNQQDSGEFGLWMLEQLELGLKVVNSELDYDAMFSGVLANCVQCSECNKLSRKDEKFKILQLPFPNQYRPITGLMIARAEEPLPAGYHKIHVDLNINQTRNKAYRDNKAIKEAAALAAAAAAEKAAAEQRAAAASSGAGSGGGSSGGSSGGGKSDNSEKELNDEKDARKVAQALKEKKQRESALYLCHSRDKKSSPITDVKLVFVYKEKPKPIPTLQADAAAVAAAAAAAVAAPAGATATPAIPVVAVTVPAAGAPAGTPAVAPKKGGDAMDVDDDELDALVEANTGPDGKLEEKKSAPAAMADGKTKPAVATAASTPVPVKADAKAPAAVQDRGRVLILIVPNIERGVIPKEVRANIPPNYELIPVNLNQPAPENANEEETESLYILISRSELCGSPVTAIDITPNNDPKPGIEKLKMYPNVWNPYPPPLPVAPPPNPAGGDAAKPIKVPPQGPALTLCLSFTGCPIVDLKLVSGETAEVLPPPGYRKLPNDFRLAHAGYQPTDAKTPFTFLCYKRGLSPPITQIEIAKTPERVEQLRAEQYEILVPPLRKSDSSSNSGSPAICFRRGDGCPLSSIVVHRGHNEPPAYGDSQLLYVYQEPLPPAPVVVPPQAAPAPAAASAAGSAAAVASAAANAAAFDPPLPPAPIVASKWSVMSNGFPMGLQFENLSAIRGRRVSGKYDHHDGKINGILWRLDAPSSHTVGIPVLTPDAKTGVIAPGAAAAAAASNAAAVGCWVFEGTFTQSNYHRQGYCAFRWDRENAAFDGVWSYGEEFGTWNGCRMADEAPPVPKIRLFTHDRKPIYALADGRLTCADAVHAPQTEHFVYTIVPGGSDGTEIVYLTTHFGKFVTADETGVVTATATTRAADDPSTWYAEVGADNVRSFRSLYGNVLCCNPDGSIVSRVDKDGEDCSRFRMIPVPLPPKDGSEKIAGTWATSIANLEIQIHGEVLATRTRAVCGDSARGIVLVDEKAGAGSPLKEDAGTLIFEGSIYHEQKVGYIMEGKWRRGLNALARYIRLEFQPVNKLEKMRGWLFLGEKYQHIDGRTDNYICLATLKDYNEQWLSGRQVASSMAETEDLDSMLKQFLNRQVMDDKNKYRCNSCGVLRRAERFTKIMRAPSHLRVTLNRFSYDFRTNQKSKIFQEIDFPVNFCLPVSESTADGTLSASSATAGYQYGLYAVIIHSGNSADVGHYYCYARESDASDLTERESKSAPWYRFDDSNVTRSSFTEIQEVTNRSPQDSAYILWYRLTAVPQQSATATAAAAAPRNPEAGSAIAPSPAPAVAAESKVGDSKSAPPTSALAAVLAVPRISDPNAGITSIASIPHALHKHSDAVRVPRHEWQLTGTVPQAVYNDNRYYLTSDIERYANTGAMRPDFHYDNALRQAWTAILPADDELTAIGIERANQRRKAAAAAAAAGVGSGSSTALQPAVDSKSAAAPSAAQCSFLSDARDVDDFPVFVRDSQTSASAAFQAAAILSEAERKSLTKLAAAASASATPVDPKAVVAAAASATAADSFVTCPNGCGQSLTRVGLASHIQSACTHTLIPCVACTRPIRRSGACDCMYRQLAVVSCLYCHSRVLMGELSAHEQRCESTGFEKHLQAKEQRRLAQLQLEELARKQKEEKDAKEQAAKAKEQSRADAAAKAKEAREGKTANPTTAKQPAPTAGRQNQPQPQPQPQAPAPQPKGTPKFECPLCSTAFPTQEKLLTHVETCVQ